MPSPSSSSSFLCCGAAAALQRPSTLRSLLQRCSTLRSRCSAAPLCGATLQRRSKLRSLLQRRSTLLLSSGGTAPVFPGSPSSPPIENSSPPAVPMQPGWSAPSYNPPYSVGATPQPTPVYFYPPLAPSVPNAHPAPVAFAPTVATAPPWTTTTPNAPAYGPPTPPAPTANAPVYGPPTTPLTPPAPTVQTPPVTKTWCVAKPGADVQDLSNALNYACGQGAANCVPIQPGNQCYEPNTLASHASYAFNSYYQLNGGNYWNCYFGDTGIISITDLSYDGCEFP